MDPNHFPKPMEEVHRPLENVVNVEMRRCEQFNLKWGGNERWIPYVAASNRYGGVKEDVGSGIGRGCLANSD